LHFTPPRGVRVDAAIETGSDVSGFYDPMIAKVIAYGPDRRTALARLDLALAQTVVLGVDTNIAFLRRLCTNARVVAGDVDTGLIETLLPVVAETPSASMLTAARRRWEKDRVPVSAQRVPSVWEALTDVGAREVVFLTDSDETIEVPTDAAASTSVRTATASDGSIWVSERGRTAKLRPLSRRQLLQRRLDAQHPIAKATTPEARAPMPGSIVAVHVEDGAP